MPPLPLDERIVVIQHHKNVAVRGSSPQTSPQPNSHITPARHKPLSHPSHPCPPQPPPSPPWSNSLSLECKRRSSTRLQKTKGDKAIVSEGVRHTPSHCHSNGTVTLGPRPHQHTHTIDIHLSVNKGTKGGGHSNSLGRSGSVKGSKKRVSLRLDPGYGDRRAGGTSGKLGGAVQQLQNHPQNQSEYLHSSHHQNHLAVSPGGVLEFVPAQRQQFKRDKKQDLPLEFYPGSFSPRGSRQVRCVGNKENSKLGPVHQNPNPHSLSRHHNSVPVPHASVLNSHCPPSPPSQHPCAPTSFQQPHNQPHPPRGRDHRPQLLHGLPLSPCSSRGGFPSPDHTCTIDFSHPFSCGCWKLVRCRGSGGRPAGCQAGGGSPSSSFSCAHGHRVGEVNHRGGAAMGLRTLGGCLSAASTTNTSSSNSTVSDCRTGLLRPLRCASCSGEAGAFESPAEFRKKLVGGCLPCTPISSSAPLRALQSCVSGCNPKASQAGSSTCSYCSSDPIVVTFNPRRGGKPPGIGRGIGAGHTMGAFPADDDDYSVRTIWPEELAKKMTRSKTQQNHQSCAGMGMGVGKTCAGQNQNSSNGTSPVTLDCRNLLEFTRNQITDHAGRRRLQQGKMAVLDFIGSGPGRDPGRDSLKRLWNKSGETGMVDGLGQEDDMTYPHTPSPRTPSPQTPSSFSPPPSAPSTLLKPKPRQRDSEGRHSLPSAQSLHLVLNSLNRDQDEDNSRVHLSLPLSSSLPASLSDESGMTPDVENAVISPILPFLFLGNERDAQDLDLLLRLNIGYVVNVTTHLPLYHLGSGLVRYKRLPATDNSKQNLRQYFEEVFEFIEEAHQSGRGVLVHCQAGVSRSATIVIAYLMKHTLMTMTDAYKYVRGRRPVVSPNLNFMGQLLEFERDLNSGVTPRILTPKLSGLETQV
ncbi:uncharacterized protein si:dkey-175m17.7 [Esox lucius]|uniref:protein-tyrosine-phosphatase n=1 Tax=Esox lucius TaxID=8010 RepID=A0A3P9A6P0_ESOLU|nr:uncharacterized protein si:dkey-175m17.7 [Esox lucius]XP_010868955.1 uncharacterized protein si:dkey-175m17.7 [Esox lucius]XP_010868956.1 uncharacterized protein si:dkey-175m17.7 [Esox lucius]XP_019903276.1 uncharacterized protein si:dkey-175m17.7 [Esox lucius]